MASEILKTEVKDGVLVISIAMQEPKASASGKTEIVATTGGTKQTEVLVNGKPVYIGLNAWIKP